MRPSLTLTFLATYLDNYLGSAHFLHDQHGVYRPSQRPIKRIGLALEPWSEIGLWVREERLDALFLHRPYRLDISLLPVDVGVLSYHLAFDFNLTFGFNLRLANVLQLTNLVPFAIKDNIPLGMLGDIAPTTLDSFLQCLEEVFGAPPEVNAKYAEPVQRIAISGAMTDTLIRDAAAQNVQLYITGQFRQPARIAVQETRLTVATIGHASGEYWGLQSLASLLHERWAQLDVVIAAQDRVYSK